MEHTTMWLFRHLCSIQKINYKKTPWLVLLCFSMKLLPEFLILFQIVTSLVFSILAAVFVIPVLAISASGLFQSVNLIYSSQWLRENFHSRDHIRYARAFEEEARLKVQTSWYLHLHLFRHRPCTWPREVLLLLLLLQQWKTCKY